MCDNELLVTYVYDELQGPERQAFEAHLDGCPSCRAEVAALRGTRVHLASWTPQEPDLRFQIVRGAPVPSRARWSRAWGLAAAAVLVLAVASAVANVEISTSGGGITVRTGWSGGTDTAAAPAAQSEEIVALQRRLRELETALANRPAIQPIVPVSSTSAAVDSRAADAEILRRVRQMIAESDSRQERDFAARLIGVMRELQVSHTSDLVRLQQLVNQNQGAINDEVFRQREEMKNWYRLVGSQR